MYCALNYLQYKDGTNMCNINRDDASGYRLDTLTTHHQYSSPVVQGKEILTTHTDYVTPYPSVLQTTSYNFSNTDNTSETCAGVVKAHSLFPKNAAQHAADLEMLQHKPELATVFINPETRTIKAVECIRVDGASNEGPSHHETQFYWTERHLKEAKLATLVTTRSSGSSYLSRVELQNGCLSRAHSNLFIPSALNGSCYSEETGKMDENLLHRNLELAAEIYIQRCNECPCGSTIIHLYKGALSDQKR